jgi:hypothetical protein
MRVKESSLPKSMTVLGTMLDAMNLPEGHACCPKCSGYKFEISGYPGGHKIEMGCVGCGDRFYIAFPVDVDLLQGRYYCRKHKSKAFILIHNIDVISMGCEACKTEINICLRKAKGIVIASE